MFTRGKSLNIALLVDGRKQNVITAIIEMIQHVWRRELVVVGLG